MKIRIAWNERFPDYFINEAGANLLDCELTEEEIAFCKKAAVDYSKAQEILERARSKAAQEFLNRA